LAASGFSGALATGLLAGGGVIASNFAFSIARDFFPIDYLQD
jgi:hypothetical protein